jgi:hypothetical protein
VEQLLAAAATLSDQAEAALKQGDVTTWARDLRLVEDLVRRANAQAAESTGRPPPTTPPSTTTTAPKAKAKATTTTVARA